MVYDLSNELQAENFKSRCNMLYKRKVTVELKERKPRRSIRQNSYLHAALGFFGLQFGYRLEEVKEWYFKEVCNRALFETIIKDRITGEERKVMRSSASLSTDEMTLAIERFRDWASQTAGVYIPSPEEHRLVEQMEIELQRAQQYI